jgi:hypothetical protein
LAVLDRGAVENAVLEVALAGGERHHGIEEAGQPAEAQRWDEVAVSRQNGGF